MNVEEAEFPPNTGDMIPLPESIGEILSILVMCLVFGGFGGLVAHFVNNEKALKGSAGEDSPSASTSELYFFPSVFQSMCIGVAGALGFLFFMVAVGGIASSFQGLTAYLRVISTSVIAGFGARRLLSRMADHLEQQVADAQSTADAAIMESKENEERLDLLETNMKLLEAADNPEVRALRDDAIERGEALIRNGRANAVTWIQLARVYRWNKDLYAAIDTLNKFIKLATSGEFAERTLNPAYYNRGCYYALLYKDSKESSCLTKCLADLGSALDTCRDKAAEKKTVWNDNDWNHLANEPDFIKIVGQKG